MKSEMKNGMIGAIFFRASFRRLDNLPFRLDSFNGTTSPKVWLCHHVDGTLSAVLKKPEHGVRPVVLFSNNPKVRNE